MIVDFTGRAGTSMLLKNNAKAPFPSGVGNTLSSIMQFQVVTATSTDTTTPPGQLQLPAIQPLPAPVGTREIMLNEVIDPITGVPQASASSTVFGKVSTLEPWR